MSSSLVNDGRRIKEILEHVAELPDDARYPLAHYKWATNQAWLLRDYFGHKVTESDRYSEIGEEHLTSLDAMLVVHFVEAFERFLKEIAAICVDHLAPCVLDDRFDDFFTLKGSVLAAHFGAETVGASLCESSTWTDCKTVNDRFRRMLRTPFEPKQREFYVFPSQGQSAGEEVFRHEHMMLIWQLRHTLVHNLGLITKSDAIKLGLLVKSNVEPRKLLRPTKDDLRHITTFLGETAESINRRVGERLQELLSGEFAKNPHLFDPQAKADTLASQFGCAMTVAGKTGGLS